MLPYLVRRLLSGVLLLVALTLLTYVVFYTIPVHPGCLVVNCGPHSLTTPAQLKAADHLVGADKPVLEQYGHFLWRLVRHASLGRTFSGNQSVKGIILDSLPTTASLVLGGGVLLMLLALPLAMLAALHPRSLIDRGVLVVSLFGIALHPFVVGLILRTVFAKHLGLAPDRGYCSLTSSSIECNGVEQWASHLALPWLTFALFFLPLYTRMLRSRLLETLGEQHVLTARAKGASELRVVRSHLLRAALPPVLAMLAIDMGTAVTAAIYVETIFGMQGIGALTLQALSGDLGGYDLPTIVGIVFTVAVAIVVLNLVADVASAWLDPRIRLRSTSGLVRLPAPVTRVTEPIRRFFGGRVPATAVKVAVAAGIAFFAFHLATLHHRRHTALALPAEPRQTIRLDWREQGSVQTAQLSFRVRSVSVGQKSWIVAAELTNRSARGVEVLPADTSGKNANVAGLSLLVPGRSELSPFVGLRILPAKDVLPSLPKVLNPGQHWSGRFGGVGKLPRGTTVYVGIGNFKVPGHESANSANPFLANEAGVTWITQHSFTLKSAFR